MRLAFSDVVAIDAHIHLKDGRPTERSKYQDQYFRNEDHRPKSIDEVAEEYRGRKMMAVLLNGTEVTISGRERLPNDAVADAVRAHPDVFIGFGAIDPWQGKLAIDEVRRCKEELGLTGIGELNPARQHFYPNDPKFYPIWQTAEELGMPILFHTGMAAAGAGAPGGMGVKLKYTQPIHLDDVAADFPDLKIIAAHPSWPWQSESLAIARHKPNYYIDMSGWAPKYWSDELISYVNSILQDKALFGSDTIDMDRWLAEFAELPFKDEVRQKIMRDNAVTFFGLS
jgi:hypothetical protein